MSHELRTPLNSILILAKLLADDKNNNKDEKQIEHAKIIYKSGSDLLTLINDILDLSKIEAGKVQLEYEMVPVTSLIGDLYMLFSELANEKQIVFSVSSRLEEDKSIAIDRMRVEQIVKNLLSNAFKFTPANAKVELIVDYAASDIVFKEKNLLKTDRVLSIQVVDQGIGIPEEKQKLVFEVFQQADGSTNRKFGGTGLGLAISKELASIMGGEIHLKSKEGVGSTFTLYLPDEVDADFITTDDTDSKLNLEEVITNYDQQPIYNAPTLNVYQADEIKDDRRAIFENDRVILIVEDDYIFARMLMNHCHKYGFKAIIALQGDQGLSYAKKYNPYAIILDMRLPIMDGWTVLKKLKEDEVMKNIPVHIISSIDKKHLGLDMGAASYLSKPAGTDEMDLLFHQIDIKKFNVSRKILYMGDRKEELERVIAVLRQREEEIILEIGANLQQCVGLAKQQRFECLIVDEIKDKSSTQKLVNSIRSEAQFKSIPLVFCPDQPDECLREIEDLFSKEHNDGRQDALDETGLFLDTVQTDRNNYNNVQVKMNKLLTGKTVLIVDDDMRNIYSMTNSLENEGLTVICAYDGVDALEKLRANKQIELVLMDIMMPGMNGYETMTEIRKKPEWSKLPLIAVTAKAMNGDREKCMEAGASDYLTKPLNIDQLISLMRVWLYN
jgi:CheY-like chemotaxis protein